MAAEARVMDAGVDVACALCGARDLVAIVSRVRDQEYGTPGEWSWLRCEGCGLVRIDPWPSCEALARAYPPNYHAHVEAKSKLTRALQRFADRREARSLARGLPAGAVLLDVGCGTGRLLAEVGRLGSFQLLGVETDADAAKVARARGVFVFSGELEDAPFAAGTIDRIALRHVIEHVRDPLATLETCHALLEPGGSLRAELPNIASFDAWLFGRHWGGGHAPRHLHHFTPSSIGSALERAGFVDVRVTPALHTGHWALSVQNWLRRKRRDVDGLHAGRAVIYPPLLLLLLPINALQCVGTHTGVMRVSARKPR